jgi:hypothetical protein
VVAYCQVEEAVVEDYYCTVGTDSSHNIAGYFVRAVAAHPVASFPELCHL